MYQEVHFTFGAQRRYPNNIIIMLNKTVMRSTWRNRNYSYTHVLSSNNAWVMYT